MGDKILTKKQKKIIIVMFINHLKMGNEFSMDYTSRLVSNSDTHKFIISISSFDRSSIFRLRIKNLKTNEDVFVDTNAKDVKDVKDVKDMNKEIAFLQNHVDSVLNITRDSTISDDDFNDLIGLDDLLNNRSQKLERIRKNIKNKNSIFSRFKLKRK